MINCYCCSGKKFGECCEPFLAGNEKPKTAEALMRSRYSAYTTTNIDYIIQTTHHSQLASHDAESIENWAKSSLWQKLEIVSKDKGSNQDEIGVVEFKAYYLDLRLDPHVHHERSNFKKESGKWFFVDGEIVSKST
jgi:SEC-C motif domain protein